MYIITHIELNAYNNMLLRDTVHQTSRGESATIRLTTVSRNYTVLILIPCQKYKLQSIFTRAVDVA